MPPKKRNGGVQAKVPVKIRNVQTKEEGSVLVPSNVWVQPPGRGHSRGGRGRRKNGQQQRRRRRRRRLSASASNTTIEKGAHQGDPIFDWPRSNTTSCSARGGAVISVDKDVRMRYEIVKLSSDDGLTARRPPPPPPPPPPPLASRVEEICCAMKRRWHCSALVDDGQRAF